MSYFRLSSDAQKWFAPAFADEGPLHVEFDKYYLCLLIGIKTRRRDQLDSSATGFIEYWISDYQGVRELMLGLILKAELDNRGIQTAERDAVQATCKRIFTHDDQTQLTADGMKVANSIAHGGFKTLEESFPGNTSPRSQFELLTHVATLLAES
jgi:hypothetical protein